MKKDIWIQLVLLAIFVIVAIVLLKYCNKPGITIVTHRTDTIYKKFYIHDTITKIKVLTPDIVTLYKDSLIPEYRYIKDTVYLKTDTGFKFGFKVNENFLLNYMGSPKLISGRFSLDTMSLILLDTSGRITRKEYFMEYDKYKYLFKGEDLGLIVDSKLKPIDFSSKLKSFTTESNLYMTYDFIDKSARLAIDYSVLYKQRFGLYGFTSLKTVKSKPFETGIGLRVKVK